MAIKATAIVAHIIAWDTLANVGKAGDSGNLTLRVVKDGIAGTRHSGTAIAEIDATYTPGLIAVPLDATDTNASVISVHGISSTTGVVIIPWTTTTEGGQLATLTAAVNAINPLGVGALTYTYTLYNDAVPAVTIADALVWITTDAAGGNVIASGTTNDHGQVTFYLDTGSYFIWKVRSGFNFQNPSAILV